MGRIQFTDKTKPDIRFDDPRTRRRLTDADVEQALGAEFIGAAPKGGNAVSAYALQNVGPTLTFSLRINRWTMPCRPQFKADLDVLMSL
jgi:hypothetical protein